MTAYTVYSEQIPALLRKWSKRFDIYVPQREPHGFFDFAPWNDDVEIAWDYDVAYNSLKRFFLPPRETLLRFDRERCLAEPVFDTNPRLLLGVHSYDLRAINQVDQLMDMGIPDPHYLKRRDATVIMALEPQNISPTAFWGSVGAETVRHGFDLYWTAIGPASFYVEIGSSRGEELLLVDGTPSKATLVEREAAKRERKRIRTLAADNGLRFPWIDTPRMLARSWNSPIWRHKAEKCLSCGSCVMVCPTCYCYEVRDDVDINLNTGTRWREWHGCMLPSFQLVAGGHNFTPEAKERYRHRYFRKGKYIYDKIGELGCVGCGRCVRACTAGIANPMAVYNELWEAEQHESK